jgi:hypothetical protein
MGARTDLPAACIRATRHGRLSIERRSLRFTHGSAGHVRTSVAATGQGPRLPVPTRHGLLPGASLRTAAKNPHSTHHPCPNWGPRSYYLNAQSSVMGKIRQYDKLRDAIEQMLNMTKIPSVMVSRSIMNVITDKVAASLHVCKSKPFV